MEQPDFVQAIDYFTHALRVTQSLAETELDEIWENQKGASIENTDDLDDLNDLQDDTFRPDIQAAVSFTSYTNLDNIAGIISAVEKHTSFDRCLSSHTSLAEELLSVELGESRTPVGIFGSLHHRNSS